MIVNSGNRNHVHMETALAGPLFMLSAALLFTLLNIVVKLLGPEYRVWDIGFYRFFGGVLVLLIFFGRNHNPYRGKNIPLLIVRGCTGSVAFVCVVSAIRLLPVSTALVIFYSFPAFAALAAFVLYRETIGIRQLVCIAGVLAGVAVLFDFHLKGQLLGQLIALAGGVFAGLTVTLIRSLREKNGPVVIYLYFCTMGSLITLPFFLQQPVWPDTAAEWVMVLAIILVSVTGQLLMNQGFYYCRGWEGGVFMSSEVLFTAIVGVFFLGDPATWRFWGGGSLILACIVVMNRLQANGVRQASSKKTGRSPA